MKKELPIMSRLGVIFLTWRRYLQKQLLPYGISLKQLYVLRRLRKAEILSPSVVADMLYCDRPTATSILNTMKRNGWIESQKDPANRKHHIIRLTDGGTAALESLSGFAPEAMFDPTACFTAEELRQFEALLQKLQAHIHTLSDL